MNTGIASNTANSAKTLAQQIAKQMAQEPLEVLKDAREQTTGETIGQSDGQSARPPEDQQKLVQNQQELQDKMKGERRMEALDRELDDIRKQEKFSELQKRISEGEEIPLTDYPELSLEQKQVLNAQMEAVRSQIAKQQEASASGQLVEPGAKKGRKLFNFGKKQSVKQEQTRVEKPVPPSG